MALRATKSKRRAYFESLLVINALQWSVFSDDVKEVPANNKPPTKSAQFSAKFAMKEGPKQRGVLANTPWRIGRHSVEHRKTCHGASAFSPRGGAKSCHSFSGFQHSVAHNPPRGRKGKGKPTRFPHSGTLIPLQQGGAKDRQIGCREGHDAREKTLQKGK